jgi:hypothetical protein
MKVGLPVSRGSAATRRWNFQLRWKNCAHGQCEFATAIASASKMNRRVTFHQRSIDFKFESGGDRQVIGIVSRSTLSFKAAAADGGEARLPPFEIRC